ncbi:hypothetical protein K457DRAFT_536061 [Linnemannia elongata AG-77]|uniref:Uncharacterized protein n=1 Tax=Linnemannia elongata AG-77 TaxID=1314771 RepID=A0A197JUZ0_9FUNG|nr:hypothetical protein K457DRAFT_536061 [Linnemannia elongata AG-77]
MQVRSEKMETKRTWCLIFLFACLILKRVGAHKQGTLSLALCLSNAFRWIYT